LRPRAREALLAPVDEEPDRALLVERRHDERYLRRGDVAVRDEKREVVVRMDRGERDELERRAHRWKGTPRVLPAGGRSPHDCPFGAAETVVMLAARRILPRLARGQSA
jgi:hypothetical protein